MTTAGGGGALVSYMNINKAKIWVIRSIARKLKKQLPWMYICMLVDNQVIHESRKCPINFSWLVNSNAPPPPPPHFHHLWHGRLQTLIWRRPQ